MRLRFTKMHGAGNDFVVLDATRAPLPLTPELCRRLADRHFGIGCDQILIVEPPPSPAVDFGYRIVNADGGEVQQCGNGARCFAVFVRDRGLSSRSSLRVATAAGVIEPRFENDGRVSVDMGAPRLAPREVPFLTAGLLARRVRHGELWPIEIDVEPEWLGLPDDTPTPLRRDVAVLSMGNPHAVQWVDDVDSAPVAIEGPLIERHVRFPERVNAGFGQIVAPRQLRLRVYERGAGETLACGTGACAAAVAGILQGRLQSPVDVHAPGGVLTITWPGPGHSVRMTGPAVSVFEGEIDLDALAAAPATAP
jgi:diaminopimelate epimerase